MSACYCHFANDEMLYKCDTNSLLRLLFHVQSFVSLLFKSKKQTKKRIAEILSQESGAKRPKFRKLLSLQMCVCVCVKYICLRKMTDNFRLVLA